MKAYFLFIIIGLTLFTGCKKDVNVEKGYAVLGGEIINANTNFVILSKSNTVLDTILLDGNSRFLYKLKNLKAGLYTFRHGGEIQMVLLEPKDSIIFRLNTLEFDESLVYTGKGSKKNNYLINEFLQNETEEKRIFKYCQLQPDAYEKQIDSLKSLKKEKFKTFKNKYPTSPLFNKIAQANIDFNYYSSKEIYPFIHYVSNKHNILESLPKDFYNYRRRIDYNSDFFKDYYNYKSFLRSNFNNLALQQHLKHSENDHFNGKSLCYNLDRLHLIDSLVTNKNIKNNLLYNYSVKFLTKSENSKENNTILRYFLSKSTHLENKEMVRNLNQSINILLPGGKFPDIQIIDNKNTELNFSSLINKPTAIYFWSHTYYDHFKDSHYKIKELTAKYPEIGFIAINIDDYGVESWTNSLKRNRFSTDHEYQFKNPRGARQKLAIYPMTKVIIIDKEHKIINSNANIFALNFEEQLLGLINR